MAVVFQVVYLLILTTNAIGVWMKKEYIFNEISNFIERREYKNKSHSLILSFAMTTLIILLALSFVSFSIYSGIGFGETMMFVLENQDVVLISILTVFAVLVFFYGVLSIESLDFQWRKKVELKRKLDRLKINK